MCWISGSTGGTASTVAGPTGLLGDSIALDEGELYYSVQDSGLLAKVPASGGMKR